MKITLKDRTLDQGHINGAAKTQGWTLRNQGLFSEQNIETPGRKQNTWKYTDSTAANTENTNMDSQSQMTIRSGML